MTNRWTDSAMVAAVLVAAAAGAWLGFMAGAGQRFGPAAFVQPKPTAACINASEYQVLAKDYSVCAANLEEAVDLLERSVAQTNLWREAWNSCQIDLAESRGETLACRDSYGALANDVGRLQMNLQACESQE